MAAYQRSRTTKIVATIGPASWNPRTLTQLIAAGVDVARINAAHDDIATRAHLVGVVRQAAKAAGQRVAILQDLAGPKPRTGPLPEGTWLRLERGRQVWLVAGDEPMEPDRISIDDPDLVARLQPGQRVLMADGLIEMSVERREGPAVEAQVIRGGPLRGRQGVTAPGTPLPPRRITPREAADIAFAAEHDLEYLGVSFVTSAHDVEMVRDELRRHGGRAGIVAKIERREALDAIHDIVHTADAVMVARGDLGVQLPPEQVPIAQKQIIQVARRHGVPVITATQMLESMITQPLPTRAETSDVANAVLDGTDAVMLSAETATGSYPLEAVEMMDRIICTVERHYPPARPAEEQRAESIASTIARAAYDIARRSPLVNAIAVLTRTGFAAREVARERPMVPVIALTNDEFVANKLALVWGLTTVVAPFEEEDTESLIAMLAERILALGLARPGEHVLFVGSLRVHREPGHTDTLHLRQV